MHNTLGRTITFGCLNRGSYFGVIPTATLG
jgi:hypothetical protein